MLPVAKKAEKETGIPYQFIVAQWGWETGWGTNRGAKELNNHAGIKFVGSTVAGATKDGMYAKYNSTDLFIQDYKRVMNLIYYKPFTSNLKVDDRTLVQNFNKTPWAESKYDVNTMVANMKLAKELGEGIKIVEKPKTEDKPKNDTIISMPDVNTLSNSDLMDWAKVGIALGVVVSLIPKRNM